MQIGQSGLGKSTFINTLFETELYGQDFPSTIDRKKKIVSIDSSSIILKEKGVQLRLTIVDTPAFGDSVDNSNWFIFSFFFLTCLFKFILFSWKSIFDKVCYYQHHIYIVITYILRVVRTISFLHRGNIVCFFPGLHTKRKKMYIT